MEKKKKTSIFKERNVSYLREGLFFEKGMLRKLDIFNPLGYTESLDRYYDYLAGRVSTGKKPVMSISDEYKQLINDIEITKKPNFTDVTTSLLSYSSKTIKEIIASIGNLQSSLDRDGLDHDLTLFFNKEKEGLLISVTNSKTQENLLKLEQHCKLKMYQTKYNKWILVVFEIQDGKRQVDFRIFEKNWEYDPIMEEKLKRFKKAKFRKISVDKVGRNDPCPCGSGKKYKKCCWNLIEKI